MTKNSTTTGTLRCRQLSKRKKKKRQAINNSVTTLFVKSYKCFGAWNIFEVLDFMLKQNFSEFLQVLEKLLKHFLIELVLEALILVLEPMTDASIIIGESPSLNYSPTHVY